MAADGVLGNGSKVGYSDTSPVSWTRVAQLIDFDPPDFQRNQVDTTVHSTSGYERSMPGMIKVADMKVVLLFDPDESTTPSHQALWDKLVAGTTVWWRFELPCNEGQTSFKAVEFEGWVRSFKPKAPIKDRQTAEVNIAFDGDSYTVYAAGASAIS